MSTDYGSANSCGLSDSMIWQSSCLRQIEQFLLAASSDQSEIEDKMLYQLSYAGAALI
jgi:hypothetical protein